MYEAHDHEHAGKQLERKFAPQYLALLLGTAHPSAYELPGTCIIRARDLVRTFMWGIDINT